MKKFRELSGKLVVAMLAVTLLIGCAIGGTVAWLTATTDTVTNTFTYGDINIDLWETKDGMHTESRLNENGYVVNTRSDLKIIPGVDLPKDPTVTVKAGSEACWLFVKVEAENWPNFAKTDKTLKVAYAIDTNASTGWTQGDGPKIPSNVYYRSVTTSDANQDFSVLNGNEITVSDELTKAEINGLEEAAKTPKLTFTAYAVQKDGISTAADAWDKVSAPTTTATTP